MASYYKKQRTCCRRAQKSNKMPRKNKTILEGYKNHQMKGKFSRRRDGVVELSK